MDTFLIAITAFIVIYLVLLALWWAFMHILYTRGFFAGFNREAKEAGRALDKARADLSVVVAPLFERLERKLERCKRQRG